MPNQDNQPHTDAAKEETIAAADLSANPADGTAAAENPSAAISAYHARYPPKEEPNPFKKRKVALYISYVGHGYQGMQRNPGAKTIEEDLFKAIAAAGGISEANSDEKGFTKIHWMRAARTDKGVSAVGQVCSLTMVLHPPGIVDRINANLPSQIRVYGYRRTVKGFDARKACDKRRYEYIMPAWMFDPKLKGLYVPKKETTTDDVDQAATEATGATASRTDVQGTKDVVNGNMGDDADCDSALELAVEAADEAAQPHPPAGAGGGGGASTAALYGSDSDFVFDQSCIDRLNEILRQYEGTHNFHNYTIRTAPSAPQAKRYIMSFECKGVFHIEGSSQPWVRMVVIGQSFMLHQIRKMVGMALAEFRQDAPQGCLHYALGTFTSVQTPMAPDLGLFLDECYYEAYNERWADLHEKLQLSAWQDEVDKFKAEHLYPALARRDRDEQVNAAWLWTLNEKTFKFTEWLSKPDAEKAFGKVNYEKAMIKKRLVEQEAKEKEEIAKRKRLEMVGKDQSAVKSSWDAEYSE